MIYDQVDDMHAGEKKNEANEKEGRTSRDFFS